MYIASKSQQAGKLYMPLKLVSLSSLIKLSYINIQCSNLKARI